MVWRKDKASKLLLFGVYEESSERARGKCLWKIRKIETIRGNEQVNNYYNLGYGKKRCLRN